MMGYTYVMADIHGMYDKYKSMLRMIDFGPEDTLYVLGDVIDRGPYGIRILQEMMECKNITLLAGNHELLMLQVVTSEDMESLNFQIAVENWCGNGGQVTMGDFMHSLGYKEQIKMIDYLQQCPMCLPDVEVAGRHYFLVHACPDLEGVCDDLLDVPLRIGDLCELTSAKADAIVNELLWRRISGDEEMPTGKTIIFGHTPTNHYQDNLPLKTWRNGSMWNIDCGCSRAACGDESGRLCCIRLEDEKEFYV